MPCSVTFTPYHCLLRLGWDYYANADWQTAPTAAMKMQFMQQIVQGNPKYQEALQGDERFQALLENYGKNLQQSVTQEQNKMIGRIGVQPVNQQ